MRLVLAGLVLCGCGGSQPVAIANRDEAARPSCNIPERIELEARRYANLDADQQGYDVWTAWRVGLQLSALDPPRGTLAMVGDNLTWTMDVSGKRAGCKLSLDTPNEHEGFTVDYDVATHTGTIRSIDDVWVLGPPFPTKRP